MLASLRLPSSWDVRRPVDHMRLECTEDKANSPMLKYIHLPWLIYEAARRAGRPSMVVTDLNFTESEWLHPLRLQWYHYIIQVRGPTGLRGQQLKSGASDSQETLAH